jgi:hemolysin activation/secretion protein
MKNLLFFIFCLVQTVDIFSKEFESILITEKSLSGKESRTTELIPSEVIEPFLGEEISKETLSSLKETVALFLEKKGDFAFGLSFPPQDVSSGTVVLQVAAPTVKKVTVSGNQWESENFYLTQIGLSSGETVQTSELMDEVAWFNRNPFRYVEVVLSPAGGREKVDVELLVKDRFALRPFIGADNTGTNLANETRLFAGVNWGKPFGRPDLFTYQYISAPNPHEFYAHVASYLIFLPWKHELLFSGGFSVIRPDIPNFTHEGLSTQASLRYTIPFEQFSQKTRQTFSWGFDYKNINSNVFFIGSTALIPVIAHQANISQLYLSYAWQNRFLFKLEAIYSPFQMLPNQSTERYQMLRPHSKVEYFYTRLSLADVYGRPDQFSFSWLFRAQGAIGPLLPSEQFGLGGHNTIRGYRERAFLADNIFCANLELRSPRLHFFKNKKDEFIFLAFSDIGGGYNYKSEQSNQTSQFLWGTGLGVRYQIAPYLTFRADYGFKLHDIFGQDSLGMFHLGGSTSY